MNFEAVVYVVTYKLFFIKYYRYQSVTSGVIWRFALNILKLRSSEYNYLAV